MDTTQDEPFDAEAFGTRLREKIATKRAAMLRQADPVLAVATARFIIGKNDARNEPWLTNMEALVDEIDRLRALLTEEQEGGLAAREQMIEAFQGLLTSEGETYSDPRSALCYEVRMRVNASVRFVTQRIGIKPEELEPWAYTENKGAGPTCEGCQTGCEKSAAPLVQQRTGEGVQRG